MSTATPHRSLKERQREERERLILQAGEVLIVEKGYSETSMEDIAAHVGVSKGTLYLHFASKEDLVLAILKMNLRAFAEAIDNIFAQHLSPRETLTGLIHLVYTGTTEERIRMMDSVMRVPELRARLADNKRAALRNFLGSFSERLDTVIEAGKAAGELDPAIPTPVLQAIFVGLLNPMSFNGAQLLTEHVIPRDELIGYISQFFFRGAAAQTPRQTGEGS